jgi:UPF0755 protein
VRRLLLVGAGGIILAGLLATYFLWWAPGPKRVAHDVLVPEGATLGTVSRLLAKDGAIPGSARTFYVMARIFGSNDPIQAGEFSIPKGMGGAAVLDLLQHGKPTQRLITVVPGMPSIVVQEKLAANPYLTGPPATVQEGSVLPDSYGFQRGEARAAVASRMQGSMARAVDALWPKRDYVCPLATKEQAVILASIVEKETGNAKDRAMIAAVYCNRLRIGMKLDADPTVIYPVTKGKALGRRILKSELNSDDPYNTYRRPGLPPGPITNPGKPSIEAVLHPAKSQALYFVATGAGDGSSVFANTLSEHNANVAKWYALRRQRGEM